MGKVKSLIITLLFAAAILVLALFATISCNVPGTNGVKRYNSFLSSIPLGSELSGDAYGVLYPEGVISAASYNLVVDDENNSQKDDYVSRYEKHGNLYVEKDKLGEEFSNSVKADAEVLSERFGEKGYSSYSVSVEDDYAIRVTAPTAFTYAAYKEYDASARSNALSEISYTVNYFTYSGSLGLRDKNEYDGSKSLVSITDDFKTFFKSASLYTAGGANAIKINLTKAGQEKLDTILKNYGGEEESAYFYVGETCLGLSIKFADGVTTDTMYYQPENTSKSSVQDVAILLNSAISGNEVTNSYNKNTVESTSLVATTSPLGENAPVFLLVILACVLVGAIVASIVRYRRLGLVNTLSILAYALTMIIAPMLIGIQITIGGAFMAVLGLALLTFSNFYTFEAVRKEVLGRSTFRNSVKTGYKKTFTTILDVHILLIVASAAVALIGVGEIAACGLLFFIASIASYALYWFTRFMWYVNASPVKGESAKFLFNGFKGGNTEYDD